MSLWKSIMGMSNVYVRISLRWHFHVGMSMWGSLSGKVYVGKSMWESLYEEVYVGSLSYVFIGFLSQIRRLTSKIQ